MKYIGSPTFSKYRYFSAKMSPGNFEIQVKIREGILRAGKIVLACETFNRHLVRVNTSKAQLS